MTGRGHPAAQWDGHAVAALAASWGVPHIEVWDVLSSTNDRAAELARGGAAPWTVVVAVEQSAGRGRQGRSWTSGAGAGLWMSIVAPPTTRDGARLPLPLAVGTAVAEAIDAVAPGLLCQVKWPNDLVVQGRKLGGVLCEGRRDTTVVGIGVNVETPEVGDPEDPPGTPGIGPLRPIGLVALAGGAGAPSHATLAGEVVRRLRATLSEATDPASLLERFRSRDALCGRRVVSETGGVGVARGVTEDGSLVLEREDGTRVHVVSGSVRWASDRS